MRLTLRGGCLNNQLLSESWHHVCQNLEAQFKVSTHTTREAFIEVSAKDDGYTKSELLMYLKFSEFSRMCRNSNMLLAEIPRHVERLLKLPKKNWLDAWAECMKYGSTESRVSIDSCLAHHGRIPKDERKKDPKHLANLAAKRVKGGLDSIKDVNFVQPANGLDDVELETAARLFERRANR